jgi:hypothetical protein
VEVTTSHDWQARIDIDQIQVGFRYRKDLGDLRTLAKSIEEVGLLLSWSRPKEG